MKSVGAPAAPSPSGRLQVEIMDVLEEAKLGKLCAERRFAACIHSAGPKAVGESVARA